MTRTSKPLVWCGLILLAAPAFAQFEEGPGDVPYVPTPAETVEAMLKLAGVKAGDMVYDLGCGDGRIVVMAAQKFHARGTGVDINPERIKEAEENARQAGVSDRVRFIEKNLFDADIRDATVVTLYLLPEVNLRLRPKLLSDLKTGTRIVSHSFNMGDWEPDKKVEINHRTLYLWTITDTAKQRFGERQKASLDGDWTFKMPTPNGEMEALLTLKTEGNRLGGAIAFGDRKLDLQDGSVEGNDVKFTVRRERAQGGTMVYKMSGKVDGDQIRGKTETDMGGQPVTQEWSARRK